MISKKNRKILISLEYDVFFGENVLNYKMLLILFIVLRIF